MNLCKVETDLHYAVASGNRSTVEKRKLESVSEGGVDAPKRAAGQPHEFP
jgi:hypothetical protein